ncbi:MAG: GIY-YIG nuclease family protein [Elusimicrobiota bacterium]
MPRTEGGKKPAVRRTARRPRRGEKREWSVYILVCGDGSYYTGVAKDVERRLRFHNEGRGAAYTRSHLPVALAYRKKGFTRSQALIKEAAIKALPRAKKILLVNCSSAGIPFRRGG